MTEEKQLVRSGTTVGNLVRAISDMIVSGHFRPGDKLDEHSLATRFEVSRTPIKQALVQLGAMGLVHQRPNRSSTVAVVTAEYLASMFEIMAELEAICARFSALRMSPAERADLQRKHIASQRLVQRGAQKEYEAHNTDFHMQLYLGAHSDHVLELLSHTRNRLAPFRRAQFRLPGRLAKSWDEHDAIVTAIMRADAVAAAEAARRHVAVVGSASQVFTTEPPLPAAPGGARAPAATA